MVGDAAEFEFVMAICNLALLLPCFGELQELIASMVWE